MNTRRHSDRIARLNRIEGQVRGIARMVEDDRYCVDVITQISAVRAALSRVEQAVLKAHIEQCVQSALTAADIEDQRAMIAELNSLLRRSARD